MAIADSIARMRDHLYARGGVPAVWTPAGGAAVPLTVLASLGDQTAQVHGVGDMTTEVPSIRVRVSEISAAAPGIDPASDDLITVAGADYCISGAPQKRDARRMEWTFELAQA